MMLTQRRLLSKYPEFLLQEIASFLPFTRLDFSKTEATTERVESHFPFQGLKVYVSKKSTKFRVLHFLNQLKRYKRSFICKQVKIYLTERISFSLIRSVLRVRHLKNAEIVCTSLSCYGICAISKLLELDYASLKGLTLRSCDFSNGSGLQQFAKTLENNKTLKVISFQEIKARASLLENLLERCFQNESIVSVLTAVAPVEKSHPLKFTFGSNLNLKHIDLSDTWLSESTIRLLGNMLETNGIVVLIDLSKTDITDKGIFALSKALRRNNTLRTLNLSRNRISEVGIQCLCKALEVNSGLLKLSLNHNQLMPESSKAIKNMLIANSSLRVLHMTSNKLGTSGGNMIIDALTFNCSIYELRLCSNNLGGLCAKYCLEKLCNMKSLKYLSLQNNNIGEKLINQLKKRGELRTPSLCLL